MIMPKVPILLDGPDDDEGAAEFAKRFTAAFRAAVEKSEESGPHKGAQ